MEKRGLIVIVMLILASAAFASYLNNSYMPDEIEVEFEVPMTGYGMADVTGVPIIEFVIRAEDSSSGEEEIVYVIPKNTQDMKNIIEISGPNPEFIGKSGDVYKYEVSSPSMMQTLKHDAKVLGSTVTFSYNVAKSAANAIKNAAKKVVRKVVCKPYCKSWKKKWGRKIYCKRWGCK